MLIRDFEFLKTAVVLILVSSFVLLVDRSSRLTAQEIVPPNVLLISLDDPGEWTILAKNPECSGKLAELQVLVSTDSAALISPIANASQ